MKFDLTSTKMPWGKCKDTPINKLDDDYLLYLIEGGCKNQKILWILVYEWDKRRKKIMDKQVQTRSEKNGLQMHDSIKNAIAASMKDDSIWKISFNAQSGERVRMTRENYAAPFIYDPLIKED